LAVTLTATSLHLDGLLAEGWSVTGLRSTVTGSERSFDTQIEASPHFVFDIDLMTQYRSLGETTGSYDFFLMIRRPDGTDAAVRLGRFARTDRSGAVDPASVGTTKAWVHLTEPGNISLVFGEEPPRRVTAVTLRLVSGERGLHARQLLTTYARPLDSASLSWTSRSTGHRHAEPLEIRRSLDPGERFGHFAYEVSGTLHPPAELVAEHSDVHDPFVEVRLAGIASAIRVPIRPGAHTRLGDLVVADGDLRHVLVPHLTFRGQRLAFWPEHFPVEAHRHLRRLLPVAWLLAPLRPLLGIWLVGETPYKAQDNGYAFFAWIREHHPRRRAYYVIEGDSPDRPRVESLGHVVVRHSTAHVWLTLLASRLVGSHDADYLVVSRSRRALRRTGGIRVFLQHGVTAMKDVTAKYGLRRMVEQPPDLFVVNAEREQDIVVERLEYRRSQVPITGFTRFDRLLADDVLPERRIVVMPTWRDWLADAATVRASDFLRHWRAFVTDPRLVEAARDAGMTIELVLHPNMRHLADLFDAPGVQVRGADDDVQHLLKSSSLLVTDYSSVAWDFAFLERPVVFLQFDVERFVGRATPYLDYAAELPGEVTDTPTEAVGAVVRALSTGMRPEHQERARAFLRDRDGRANERTYRVVRRADGLTTRWSRWRSTWLRRDLDIHMRRHAQRARRVVGRVLRRLGMKRGAPAGGPAPAVLAQIRLAPRRGDAWWAQLRERMRTLPATEREGWGLHDRVACWLVEHDRRDLLVGALVDRDRFGPSFRSVRDDADGLARPGYDLPHDISDSLLKPRARDLVLGLQIDQVRTPEAWHVRGAAFVRGMRFMLPADTIELSIGGHLVDVEFDPDPLVDSVSDDRWVSYAASGFRAQVCPPPPPGTEVRVTVVSGGISRTGTISVQAAPADPATVIEVAPTAQGLQLRLDAVADGAILMAHGLRHEYAGEVSDATVELGPGTSPPGDYRMVLSDAGSRSAVVLGDAVAAQLPVHGSTGSVAWRLTQDADGVLMTVRSPLDLAERGRLGQRRLIERVRENPPEPTEAIVALCFEGRAAGDSVEPVVHSLARTLGWPVLWGVADRSVPIPEWATPVVLHSAAWHDALASSRLLVNNAHFPWYFQKRQHQVYVQTWHGTPLKRIGDDVPADSLGLAYRDLMSRETASWDLLIAQSPEAAALLSGAFGVDPRRVIASGYPRNDPLLSATAQQHRADVRTRLGLRDDDRAVLYAPTWRDGARVRGSAALITHLDPLRLRALAGSDVTVLLRGHSNTARGRERQRHVVDVTDDPDLPGLYLAADVLVTDYSSVMFDFAVTGKPMIFLAPDLAEYRDATRGFYVDLEEIAPGPVVSTTDEVAAVLASADCGRDAAGYAAFVERFVPHDDGGATDRVVSRIMDLLSDGFGGDVPDD